jgi:hypothetical protein
MVASRDRTIVGNHKDPDPANAWENETCMTAIKRLENGPTTPSSSAQMFTDQTFFGFDQLYWNEYSEDI